MAGLVQDVRHAFKQLLKSPGFSAAAVLMLALGICANSTVFSWIDGTMLHPIPKARNTGELFSVMRGQWNTSPSPPFSYPDYRDLRDRNRSFSGILAYHHEWMTLTGVANPQRIYVTNASSNYFDMLGIQPLMGRFFRMDEEARPGGTPYIVLSYALWQTRFGSDPEIVGKPIEVAQRHFTVIGVAPKGFTGCMTGIRSDAWVPLAPNPDPGGNDWIQYRDVTWLNVMARLRPGVSRQSATQDLETLMRQIVAAYPHQHTGMNTITIDPLWRSPFGANIYMAASLPILLAIAGVVLLLTCANIATLALVRFVARRRELAIRQSLGASRMGLMRQMILEGLLLAFAAGGVAVLLTVWTSKALARFIPPNASPILLNGAMNGDVLAAILVLIVAACVLSGALPAWRSSRVSAAVVLKEEAASVSGGGHNRRLLSGLVVAQVALSLALLVTSGLFLRTLKNSVEADPGFDQTHVLDASVDLASSGYSNDQMRAFQHKILANLEAIPGVTTAAITDWVPLDLNRKTSDAYPDGYVPQLHESLEVRRADVTAGYFDTLKIPIVQGRGFTHDDNENAPRVLIVDQTAAAHYWPGQNPLGRRLHVSDSWFTVVGVARNSKHQRIGETAEPMIYMSRFQEGGPETILQVRTVGDPRALIPAVEQAVHQVNAQLPVFEVRPMQEVTQVSVMFEKMEAFFAAVLGLLALVLATTGIYGVVAYRTQLRTHEIGIRVALGASRRDVLRLVLLQGLRMAAAGLVLGLALSLVFTRLLRGMLYGVSATDPLTGIAVALILVGVAALASYLPALKAMRINPVNAMREQ